MLMSKTSKLLRDISERRLRHTLSDKGGDLLLILSNQIDFGVEVCLWTHFGLQKETLARLFKALHRFISGSGAKTKKQEFFKISVFDF